MKNSFSRQANRELTRVKTIFYRSGLSTTIFVTRKEVTRFPILISRVETLHEYEARPTLASLFLEQSLTRMSLFLCKTARHGMMLSLFHFDWFFSLSFHLKALSCETSSITSSILPPPFHPGMAQLRAWTPPARATKHSFDYFTQGLFLWRDRLLDHHRANLLLGLVSKRDKLSSFFGGVE